MIRRGLGIVKKEYPQQRSMFPSGWSSRSGEDLDFELREGAAAEGLQDAGEGGEREVPRLGKVKPTARGEMGARETGVTIRFRFLISDAI